VWREALTIIVRHPLATVVPALFLGALIETPHLIPDSRSFLETTLAFVVESLAFYLYVAYAERLTSEARRSPEPISVLRNLFLAAPVVPIVAFASLAAIALPTAAASLLVVPGIWVMTRWSLFAPVIVSELLGPLAALKRSNELVRGNFELVCNRADTAGGFPRDRARVRPPTAHGGPHSHLSRPRQRDTSLGASRTAQKRTASYHNLRNRTPRTWWFSPFCRIRLALSLVGTMFSRRFTPLMSAQIPAVTCLASSVERWA
jgi:hypothetical protein